MSKSLDRLSLLETFVRIVDAGSISAAARDVGLSQPSVSRQLAELESRFQTQLIQRTTHTLSLTAAGSELLLDARRLLDDWTALEEKHIESTKTLRGKLKVVAPVALGQCHLIDIVLRLQRENPLLSLSWQLKDEEIRFAETGCDCWIKIGAITDSSLSIEPLAKVERLVVAAPTLLNAWPKNPKPQTLNTLPCIALDPFEGKQIPLQNTKEKTAKRTAAKRTIVIRPNVRMSTNNIFALHRMAVAGLGIAVLPKWFIQSELESGKLIDLLPDWRAPTLTIHIGLLNGRYRAYKLQQFVNLMKAEIVNIPGIDQV